MEHEDDVARSRLHRLVLLVAPVVYSTWWFLVELMLPHSFNPFASRMAVCAAACLVYASTYFSAWARLHSGMLIQLVAAVVTVHYFYLFSHNTEDWNWIVGTYITVMATGLYLIVTTRRAVALYTLLVILLYVPLARTSTDVGVGFAGLLTVILLLNIASWLWHRSVRELRESRNRMSQLIDAAQEGMALVRDGRVIDANPAFHRIYSLPSGAAVGKVLSQLRTERMIESSTTPMMLEGKELVLVTLLDLTERVAAEEARSQNERMAYSNAVADSINRARGTLLANLSHEFRTPLAAIMGLNSLLGESDLSTSQRLEYVSMVDENAKLLLAKIDNVLRLTSRAESSSKLSPVPTDVDAVLKDTIADIREAAFAKGLGIEVRFPSGIPGSVLLDAGKFKRTVTELLSNAIKFTESGTIYVSAEVIEDLTDGKRLLRCLVDDPGMGIGADEHHRVFEPFTQANDSLTRRHGGLGAGLSLARRLSLDMGGDVRIVRSELNRGSTFCVTVPVVV